MNTMRFEIVLFFVFLSSVNCLLRCYDCDPTSHGKCEHPTKHNAKVTQCEEEDHQCFAFYYAPKRPWVNPSGVYRGCVKKNSTLGTCEYLIQAYIHDGQIRGCSVCEENHCNDHRV